MRRKRRYEIPACHSALSLTGGLLWQILAAVKGASGERSYRSIKTQESRTAVSKRWSQSSPSRIKHPRAKSSITPSPARQIEHGTGNVRRDAVGAYSRKEAGAAEGVQAVRLTMLRMLCWWERAHVIISICIWKGNRDNATAIRLTAVKLFGLMIVSQFRPKHVTIGDRMEVFLHRWRFSAQNALSKLNEQELLEEIVMLKRIMSEDSAHFRKQLQSNDLRFIVHHAMLTCKGEKAHLRRLIWQWSQQTKSHLLDCRLKHNDHLIAMILAHRQHHHKLHTLVLRWTHAAELSRNVTKYRGSAMRQGFSKIAQTLQRWSRKQIKTALCQWMEAMRMAREGRLRSQTWTAAVDCAKEALLSEHATQSGLRMLVQVSCRWHDACVRMVLRQWIGARAKGIEGRTAAKLVGCVINGWHRKQLQMCDAQWMSRMACAKCSYEQAQLWAIVRAKYSCSQRAQLGVRLLSGVTHSAQLKSIQNRLQTWSKGAQLNREAVKETWSKQLEQQLEQQSKQTILSHRKRGVEHGCVQLGRVLCRDRGNCMQRMIKSWAEVSQQAKGGRLNQHVWTEAVKCARTTLQGEVAGISALRQLARAMHRWPLHAVKVLIQSWRCAVRQALQKRQRQHTWAESMKCATYSVHIEMKAVGAMQQLMRVMRQWPRDAVRRLMKTGAGQEGALCMPARSGPI